jgi:hypothetical protein
MRTPIPLREVAMAYTIDMYFLFSSGKGETEKEDEEWH